MVLLLFVAVIALRSLQVESVCRSDTLTSATGIIASSDYFSTPLQAGDECTFRIEPTISNVLILLVFETLFVPTAEIFVYQGDSLLWSCLRCGQVLPPPIYAEGSPVVLSFRAPVATSATAFSLRYVTNAPDISNVVVNILMAQAKLRSIQRPAGSILRDIYFEWRISPCRSSSSSACDITLQIEALSLATGDSIKIYDGSTTTATLLMDWDHRHYFTTSTTWVKATGPDMLVVLQTTHLSDKNSTFFEATMFADAASCFEGIYCACGNSGPPDNLPTREGSTMILTDGSDSTSAMETDECRWLVRPNVLSTSSSLNNETRNDEENRTWWPSSNLWAPRLTLVPERVSVKGRGGSVKVYDGYDATATVLWDCSGCENVSPPPIEASGSVLYIEYSSDSNSPFYASGDESDPRLLEWTGWRAVYWTDGHLSSRGVGSNVVTLLAGSADSVKAPFVDDTLAYASHLDYRWIIAPPDVGLIRIIINRLQLWNCSDSLQVYAGRITETTDWPDISLATYTCTTPTTEWLVAQSSALTVRLRSSGGDGGFFDFGYYSDAPKYKCGHIREPGILRAPSSIFSDGSEPKETMAKNLDCSWYIKPETDNVTEAITLVFTRLDMTGATIRVEDEGMTLLWECTGCREVPPILVSSTPAVYVHLKTTASGNQGTGFEARYFAMHVGGRGIGDSSVPLVAGAGTFVAPAAAGQLAPNLDHNWTIDGGDGRVTLAFSEMKFPDDCEAANVTVYHADDVQLGTVFCATRTPPSSWLVSSGATMTIRLRTGPTVATANFEATYFSDRPQQACGGTYNNGNWSTDGEMTTLLRTSSFVFSDGSAESDDMRPDQHCSWIISPPSVADRHIILQFPRLNLGTAGSLIVFDTQAGGILWSCTTCSAPPPPLVLRCSSARGCAMKVVYKSMSHGVLGRGFLGHYFVADAEPLSTHGNEISSLLLTDFGGRWSLQIPASDSVRLSFEKDVANLLPLESAVVIDGNDEAPQDELITQLPKHCGALEASRNASVSSRSAEYFMPIDPTTSQLHFRTTRVGQQVFAHNGTSSGAVLNSSSQRYDTLEVSPADGCEWTVEGAMTDVPRLHFLEDLALPASVTLRVFAGSSVQGKLLMERTGCLALDNCKTVRRGESISSTCGKLFVQLSPNATDTSGERFVDTAYNTTAIHVSFTVVESKSIVLCFDDPEFVKTSGVSTDGEFSLTIILVLSGGGTAVLATVIALVCYMAWLDKKEGNKLRRVTNFYAAGVVVKKSSVPVAPRIAHPRHYGQLIHSIWNSVTLKRGTCSICYSDDVSVFTLESCEHAICEACLGMYAQAALGDISMFPLRCPMHHAGCKTTITDNLARRVLPSKNYKKFVEFSDRSILGDGTNCVKCGCFVNLPTDSAELMVECPYCAYRWCVRCKCDWHPNVPCNERAEAELEEWRELQGAQRCPGCYKIIEKDDPETCNHMVHKSTDAIPCTAERTDFCYCCGIEVTPDYPHNEVDTSETVVHFPDGVFQDCRAVKLGYATMLQKRRHARRQGAERRRQSLGASRAADDDGAYGTFFTSGRVEVRPSRLR